MLDVLLLVLQIVTLVLLFLFIWWVVRSARHDLVRSVDGAPAAARQAASWEPPPWSPPGSSPAAAGGPAAPPTGYGAGAEWDWQAPAAGPYGAAAAGARIAPSVADHALDRPPAAVTAPDTPIARPVASTPEDLTARREARSAVAGGLDMSAVVRPRLIVEASPNLATGREIPLEGLVGIGRSPDSDVSLNDPFVSSTHASVSRRGPFYFVEDLGSTNGTFVNERRVAEAQLKPGTRLRIGETTFRYEE